MADPPSGAAPHLKAFTVSDMLQAALRYGEQGWAVFPVHTSGKDQQGNDRAGRPAVRWREASTTDPEVIQRWWQRWPDANVAIDTGKSNLTVLDVDPGAPEDFPDFEGETLTVNTGREGGRHHYFRGHPEVGIDNTGKVAEHVDVRGIGGFVFAPPSRSLKTGKAYQWANSERRIASIPEFVVAALEKPEPKEREKQAVETSGANDRWGQRILDSELGRLASAPEGQRNGTLFEAACNIFEAVKGGHIDEAVAWDRLEQVAEQRYAFGEPAEPNEIENTLTSAWERTDERHPAERDALSPSMVNPEDPGAEQTFKLLDLEELRNMPPPKYLLPKRVPEGVTVLFGREGAGKTFIAIDWIGAMAAKGLRILYFIGEAPKGFARRMVAWMDTHDRAGVARQNVRVITEAPLLLTDHGLRTFYATIKYAEPDLVVLDTLSRATPGVDENQPGVFSSVIQVMDAIYHWYGTSSLLVHHANAKGERPRGGTQLPGAADSIWIALRDEKQPDQYILKNPKMKDDEEQHDRLFRLNKVGDTAVVYPSEHGKM